MFYKQSNQSVHVSMNYFWSKYLIFIIVTNSGIVHGAGDANQTKWQGKKL